MKKPVILLTTGTRGDIQPYIALGLGLQAAGIQVCLASDPCFAPLAAVYGLPFAAVEGNPSMLMTQPDLQRALSLEGNWVGSLLASLAYVKAARPLYDRMLKNAWSACRDAAALVIGLPTLWGAHIAEALSIPCIYGLLQPLTRTSAYPSALLPPGLLPDWAPFNRLSHRLFDQIIWQPWRTQINHWRRTQLQLSPAPWAGISNRFYAKDAAVLYALSPQVLPCTPDWPSHHHITGFWFLAPPPGWQPPADLERFLDSGIPPIYLGFGSPGPLKQAGLTEMIRQVVDRTGFRITASLPSMRFPISITDRQVFRLEDVPHAWLFPRCAALVHHGGAGTTAAGLRAGVPTLVMPRAADQFFWGSRVAALGCGPRPLPQRSLTAAALADALQQIVPGSTFRENCLRLSTTIQAASPNGVENAVTRIQTWLSS